MRAWTFEATMKSGAKVRFRAQRVKTSPTMIEWESFKGQVDDRLMRMDWDEVAAVVRLK